MSTIGKAIHKETDHYSFLSRICRSVKSISQEKGWGMGALSVCAMTGAKIYAFAFSYFCLEGVVRSLIDVYKDDTYIVRIRPLGDVGGWSALSLFAALTIGTLASRLIKEGEYIRLQSICTKWVQDNKSIIEENPKFYDQLYEKVNAIYDAYNSQCLFSKSLISRRLTALDICSEAQPEEPDSKLSKDKVLADIFREIKKKIEEDSSAKKYFCRLYSGLKSVKQTGGCCRITGSLITGVAFPIMLLLGAVLSFVGEFGLGKEIFYDREELTDIGHFGEWPFNAIELVSVAFFLHIWCMINEGDFVRTRKIYSKHINALADDDLNLHNRLCEVANEELSQLSTGCYYFKLPSDYLFEPL